MQGYKQGERLEKEDGAKAQSCFMDAARAILDVKKDRAKAVHYEHQGVLQLIWG